MEYGKKKDIFVGSKPLNPSNKPFYRCKFDTKALNPASSKNFFTAVMLEQLLIDIITAVMLRSGLASKLMFLTREY